MKTLFKIAAAAALTGALALSAATPSEARGGRNAAAAIGFGAGALLGAAAASSARNGYYYGEPGYGYDQGYAYEPAPAYYGRRYYRSGDSSLPSCVGDLGNGRLDYGAC